MALALLFPAVGRAYWLDAVSNSRTSTAGIASNLLRLWCKRRDLDRTLGLSALNAEFAGGGVDAAGFLTRFPMRRRLRRITSHPNPFRHLLATVTIARAATSRSRHVDATVKPGQAVASSARRRFASHARR
jgi:hypothetical protein